MSSATWCPARFTTRAINFLPDAVPAEGAGCLCNFQVSLRPRTDAPAPKDAVRSEVLTFNSGGGGARATLDGMNTTAFSSGARSCGQTRAVWAAPGVGSGNSWKGATRWQPGANTAIGQDDGTPTEAKGKQFVAHSRKEKMAFQGGAGYGDAAERVPLKSTAILRAATSQSVLRAAITRWPWQRTKTCCAWPNRERYSDAGSRTTQRSVKAVL